MFDWDMWLDNALESGTDPNVRAACLGTGFCDQRCIGDDVNLCPEGAGNGTESEPPVGFCRGRFDCDDAQVCSPYDLTEAECKEEFVCDPETGFFFPYCLGSCQSRGAAACANFRNDRVDIVRDLLWDYLPEEAYNVSVAYDLAMSVIEADEGVSSGLEEVMAAVEDAAEALYSGACVEDDDCNDGMRCSTDPRCERLNFECDAVDGVHEMYAPPDLHIFTFYIQFSASLNYILTAIYLYSISRFFCRSFANFQLPYCMGLTVSEPSPFLLCRCRSDPEFECEGICELAEALELLASEIKAELSSDGSIIMVAFPNTVWPRRLIRALDPNSIRSIVLLCLPCSFISYHHRSCYVFGSSSFSLPILRSSSEFVF
jgi:hypothetical protein